MIVEQTTFFSKQKKKLYANQIRVLDEAIRHILHNPEIGLLKKGDLRSVRVYKFDMVNQEYLLAYSVSSDVILLRALGSHENFYRDLKLQVRRINELEVEYVTSK